MDVWEGWEMKVKIQTLIRGLFIVCMYELL